MRERNRPGTADAPVEKFGGGLTDAGAEVDLHSIRHPSSTIKRRTAIRTKSAWHSGGRGRPVAGDTRGLAAPLILCCGGAWRSSQKRYASPSPMLHRSTSAADGI